jgi:dATP pyrophosphohydrolase
MSRAPYQVLVLPFARTPEGVRYAVLQRADMPGCWQGIAGGGEAGELPLDAARREAFEEGGISPDHPYYPLESRCTIPVVYVSGFRWGPEVLVIPEWTFGVELGEPSLQLSDEHTEVRWVSHDEGAGLLRWDSNRGALWELDHRIENGLLRPARGDV